MKLYGRSRRNAGTKHRRLAQPTTSCTILDLHHQPIYVSMFLFTLLISCQLEFSLLQ